MALVFFAARWYFWSWQEAAVQIEIQAEEHQAEVLDRAIHRGRTLARTARKRAVAAAKVTQVLKMAAVCAMF